MSPITTRFVVATVTDALSWRYRPTPHLPRYSMRSLASKLAIFSYLEVPISILISPGEPWPTGCPRRILYFRPKAPVYHQAHRQARIRTIVPASANFSPARHAILHFFFPSFAGFCFAHLMFAAARACSGVPALLAPVSRPSLAPVTLVDHDTSNS